MLFRQIEYFQSVVEQGSFTAAAEENYISQSAISQQIQALEKELGVELLIRKNRRFTLTPAGEYFYQRTVILSAELESLCRQTVRIARQDSVQLCIGSLKCYDGDELHRAMGEFAALHPEVELRVLEGNHEELYDALRFGRADLVLNDQRRAFSEEYVNYELARADFLLEVSTHNPLSKLPGIEVDDLRQTPCVLVASRGQEKTEQTYFREIVGIRGEILFAETLQQARILMIARQGVMPVEGVGAAGYFGAGIRRIPLLRGGKPISRNYCAFWKEENAGPYAEEFARLLRACFTGEEKQAGKGGTTA